MTCVHEILAWRFDRRRWTQGERLFKGTLTLSGLANQLRQRGHLLETCVHEILRWRIPAPALPCRAIKNPSGPSQTGFEGASLLATTNGKSIETKSKAAKCANQLITGLVTLARVEASGLRGVVYGLAPED